MCPSAAGLQPKKPLCCSCFLSSSFFGCPHSFHTKYSIISKRINQYQTVHTCYRTRTSAWALLQKMTFSILRSHLNLKLLSSVQSPHLTWAIGLTTKTFHFAHHVLFLLFIWNHTKLCLGLSQGVPRYWEWMTKWWVPIFKMVQGCSRAGPQSQSSPWLLPLTSQGKPPVSQSVKKDSKTVTDLL